MNADKLKNALLTVMEQVYHHKAPAGQTRYLVWSEAGQGGDAWADGVQAAQALRYQVTLCTPQEYDPAVEQVQRALSEADISFVMAGADYVEETNTELYAWVCEVEYGAA